MKSNMRVYPACCLSAECGKCGNECHAGCEFWPTLQAFKAWVREHKARVMDAIWCPTVYTSQVDP